MNQDEQNNLSEESNLNKTRAYNFNQNMQNSVMAQNNEPPKNNKKAIVILSILCFVLFVVGLVVGPLILKAASKNIEDGTFMYNILKSTGYINEEKKQVPVEKTDDIQPNRYYFSTMSNGYYYYYMLDDHGVYNYYYTKDENINLYSTDANGIYVGTPYQVYDSDNNKPYIYLNGETKITIKMGEEFEDSGYSAYDKEDGVLTDQVMRSGSVDITKTGEYNIIYTVSDKSGNKTTEVRTIVVTE